MGRRKKQPWRWEPHKTVCGQIFERERLGPHGEPTTEWWVRQPYAYTLYDEYGEEVNIGGIDHADLEFWKKDGPVHAPYQAQRIVDAMNEKLGLVPAGASA